MKPSRIALASVLLLASALPASALGKSPPPDAARPAQSAPGAVAVNAALKAAAIEIPFPQRDVTLRFPPREET
ncbi:MAG TPA: hypothetical protein VGV06_03905 [Methylomirabilota bacterium]|nr:hypothetical protein [Methylomirabilota bacterium]